MIDFVRPHVFLELFGGIEHWSGLQQCDPDTLLGEYLNCRSSAGAGTDNHNFMFFRASSDLCHDFWFSVNSMDEPSHEGSQAWMD
jgi:hypothetical protein